MKNIALSLMLFFSLNFTFSQSSWKITSGELIVQDAPFEACHASSIVETTKGSLFITFFAGSTEGNKDVCIWLAEKSLNGWRKPYIVADGIVNDSLRYPCWNPVLFQAKQGMLFLFYKVGPNPRSWWGVVKTSSDNGKTWSSPQKLPEGILGPIKNKPLQLNDETILCPSSVETENKWKVHMEKLSYITNTWTVMPVDTTSTMKVIQPSILRHPHGNLQIVCRSDQDRVVTAWSYDNGNTWTSFSRLHLSNPNSGIDAVTLTDGTHILVYNPAIKGKDWWNNRNKLSVAISKDGIQWKDIAVLENGNKEEYSYPAVMQSKDGIVHITYTYNRKNIKHITLKRAN